MTTNLLRDRRILTVEDEYYLATELERDLEATGAVVIGPVPSVEQALALIASEPAIDAAVVDVNLGGEMAYSVADVLLGRKIPFVFTTGYSDGKLSERYPHVPRCEKPLSFPTLEKALQSVL